MNIYTLCRAAERYEMLCMMNLSDDEIRKAAGRYGIPFDSLYFFIERGASDSDFRGLRFADYVSKRKSFVELVLLNADFYEIWEHAANDM